MRTLPEVWGRAAYVERRSMRSILGTMGSTLDKRFNTFQWLPGGRQVLDIERVWVQLAREFYIHDGKLHTFCS